MSPTLNLVRASRAVPRRSASLSPPSLCHAWSRRRPPWSSAARRRRRPISTSSAAAVVPPGEVTFWRKVAAARAASDAAARRSRRRSRARAFRRAPPAVRPRRRPAPSLRPAGTHRPGRSPTPRSPRPSALRRRPIRPRRSRRAGHARACAAAGVTRALPTATVMPRPIAAGVFGMARTIAASGRCFSRKPSVRPAMIETTTVLASTSARERRQRVGRGLRLHRDHQRGDRADVALRD